MSRRSVEAGVLAALSLAALYVALLAGAFGWAHLPAGMSQDAPLVAALVVGFGAQVAVLAEIRRRHKVAHGVVAVVAASAATSVLAFGATAQLLEAGQRALTWTAAAVLVGGLVRVAHQLRTAPCLVRLERPSQRGQDLRH